MQQSIIPPTSPRAFLLDADFDARFSLAAYAASAGDEQASADLYAGAPLDEQDAWAEGWSQASAALLSGACVTDAPRAFESCYQRAWSQAYCQRCAAFSKYGY